MIELCIARLDQNSKVRANVANPRPLCGLHTASTHKHTRIGCGAHRRTRACPSHDCARIVAGGRVRDPHLLCLGEEGRWLRVGPIESQKRVKPYRSARVIIHTLGTLRYIQKALDRPQKDHAAGLKIGPRLCGPFGRPSRKEGTLGNRRICIKAGYSCPSIPIRVSVERIFAILRTFHVMVSRSFST